MLDQAKTEWARMWPLPFVAMLGLAGAGMFTFSSGVFMDELVREFGWSKTAFTSAFTAPMIVCLFAVPIIGRLIDRIGPRKIALFGIVPAVLGTTLLGLANGQVWQWWLLCLIQALGAVIVVPPVWLAAIVSRFHASRGLSLAVGLAGSGVGAAIWPIVGAFCVQHFGWRLAFPVMAFGWGLVMLPLAFFFFHSARDTGPKVEATKDSLRYRHLVLSRTFLCLAASGGLMICICYGLILHLVPILRASGMSLTAAAGLAGIAGVVSIFGRLVTGVLLDIVPSRIFAVLIFLLPLAVCVLLLQAGGSFAISLLAVVLLGLAMGAESDILTYVTSRRFDRALFGSLYSVIQTVLAVTSIAGSILAGALYDLSGSYALFLMAMMPMTVIGAVLIGMVGDAKPAAPAAHEDEVTAGRVPLAMDRPAEEGA